MPVQTRSQVMANSRMIVARMNVNNRKVNLKKQIYEPEEEDSDSEYEPEEDSDSDYEPEEEDEDDDSDSDQGEEDNDDDSDYDPEEEDADEEEYDYAEEELLFSVFNANRYHKKIYTPMCRPIITRSHTYSKRKQL